MTADGFSEISIKYYMKDNKKLKSHHCIKFKDFRSKEIDY